MIRRIALISAIILSFATYARGESYQHYIGGTHSHTSFSDGAAIADDAWDMARNKAGIDFWFITEHYHSLEKTAKLPSGEIEKSEWDYQIEKAAEMTEDGKFIALVGWEWSDNVQGHLNVLFDPAEPPPLLMTASFERLASYWLKKHKKALIGFNHPQWSTDHKLSNFENFTLVRPLMRQTVYMEVCFPEDIPYFYEALDRGWRIAPLAAQDNHSPDWGLRPEFVAVYAKELTYDGLFEAFKARRFHSTTDRALKLWFEGNGQPMGSLLKADAVELKVTIEHEKGTAPAFIKLVTNEGKVLKEWKPDSGSFSAGFDISLENETAQWFVIHAGMSDPAAFAISAPIWVRQPE